MRRPMPSPQRDGCGLTGVAAGPFRAETGEGWSPLSGPSPVTGDVYSELMAGAIHQHMCAAVW